MEVKIIDTHSHLNFEKFSPDADEVIKRSLDVGTWMINVGSQLETSQRALDLAAKYPEGVYAAVGVHPIHAHEVEFDEARLIKLVKEPACVGVGETGLDYFHLPDGEDPDQVIQAQKDAFSKQINIAQQIAKPLIIHCRDAYDDIYGILKRDAGGVARRGVVHCYAQDFQTIEKFLALDFLVSFTGIITFTKDETVLDMVRKVPMDRIMVETDAPYLAPVPHRGKRNEPNYVKFVADKIAELKQLEPEEVYAKTTETARKFFKI